MSLAEKGTYFEQYNKTIAPYLREIDIFLKSKKGGISVKKAAELFNVKEDELKNILEKEGYEKITRENFFNIMAKGKSEVCKAFGRTLEKGIPHLLLPGDISYIYSIDIEKVLEGCEKVGISEYDKTLLPILFDNISI